MNFTQHQKIIKMCLDGEWHCQNEFRRLYIFSPHKRRNEIAGIKKEGDKPTGKYYFIKTPCQHGIKGQFDYKMIENPDYQPKDQELTSEEILMRAVL